MKKNAPFNPYLAYDDYAFISYSHKDSSAVFEVILRLHEDKYRIWYDEGIEAGTEWPQIVAERVLKCSVLIAFVSKDFTASQNCRREINYAVSQKKKIVVVRLDDSDISEDMKLQLSEAEEIEYKNAEQAAGSLEDYFEKDNSCNLVGDGVTGYQPYISKHVKSTNKWFYISALAFFLLLGLSVYLIFVMKERMNGSGTAKEIVSVEVTFPGSSESSTKEVEMVSFNDVNSMIIVLQNLDEPYVFLCGNSMVSDSSVINYFIDGWYIGQERKERGGLSDLNCFKNKPVIQLALVNENLTSLQGIETLASLTYLDVSGNPLSDLSAIAQMENLKTIRILDIPSDTDLSPLAAVSSLRQVYISYDMRDQAKPLVEAGIDVIIQGG